MRSIVWSSWEVRLSLLNFWIESVIGFYVTFIYLYYIQHEAIIFHYLAIWQLFL